MEKIISNREQDITQEQPQDRAREILESFGIKEGDPVPVSLLQEIIKIHKAEIEEGLARNFYHAIKSSLFYRRNQAIDSPYYILRRPHRCVESPDKNVLDFIWYMQSKTAIPQDRWKQNDELKLVFRYGAEAARVQKEEAAHTETSFSGYDAFTLDKIALTEAGLQDLDDNALREKPVDLNAAAMPIDKNVSYDNVWQFLEQTTRAPEIFTEANAKIDEFWVKYGFPPEDAVKLKQAIYEFGNHDFKTRRAFDMIAECLIVPGKFESFLLSRFGLDLEHCELSGASKRRASYGPEEKAELYAEQAGTNVHYASIYRDTIIIDWTSRQFGKNKPLPEITDIGENETLKSQIEIKH